MKRLRILTSILIISGIFTACCSAKKAEKSKSTANVSIPGPKAIIYETTSDYSKLVPVTLSDDGKSIVSYPDVKDVFYNGELAYPTLLSKGFLLDNRGIDANVAFINLTYEDYSKLPVTPSPAELMNRIVDKKPLKSMYSCGVRSSYKNIVQELNAKIDAGDLSAFTKLK
jgi:hypothetical protein